MKDGKKGITMENWETGERCRSDQEQRRRSGSWEWSSFVLWESSGSFLFCVFFRGVFVKRWRHVCLRERRVGLGHRHVRFILLSKEFAFVSLKNKKIWVYCSFLINIIFNWFIEMLIIWDEINILLVLFYLSWSSVHFYLS